jgi:hydrophobe/amphiphile efflux-1 (HAE1) family protein
MNLTDLCLRRPVFAWMLMCGTMLFGLVALGLFPGTKGIGVSQFPDVNNPTITVSASWPGASPEDIETGLINPMEDVLAQVTGVEELTSQAKQGSARVTATFSIDRDIDLAVQDVQAKVAQIQRQLPTNVQPPTVNKSNPDDTPIVTIGISGPFSRQLLADVARYQVEDALATLDGVGQVQMMGYIDRAVRIWVDADKLNATSTTVTDITAALKAQHVTSSGGQMTNGQKAIDIRVLGEAADLETLRSIVIKRDPKTGLLTRLRDVALIEDGFEDITSVARMNGAPVQAMGILKQPGSNAVAVAAAVRTACAGIQKTLPPGMKIDVLFDTTGFIKESVNEIGLELVLAILLTAIVCWLFLGSLSSTLNVLFAIPMSLLGTIAVLYFLGWSLNTFTLLGLSLAVGLVVDDAVMVMENIFRHGEMGKDKVTAAGDGTKEITFAALAATLAVIAIFLPVAFMTGVIGKYFLQFGVTLSVAVAISYIEAITLAPARCAQMLNVHGHKGLVARAGDWVFDRLSRVYARSLASALNWPKVIVVGAIALMAGTWLFAKALKQEMVPSQDQSRLAINLTTSVGADLNESDRLTKQAEAMLARHEEIVGVQTTVNVGSSRLQVTLTEPGQRDKTQQELQTVLRKELSQIAGLRVNVQDLSQQGFAGSRGSPVEFTLRGGDWTQLIDLSEKVQKDLDGSGFVADVKSDYQLGAPELAVSPDRPAASDVGVNISDIASTITALIGGTQIGQYSTAGRRMNIDLRLLAGQRTRPEDLQLLQVRSTTGVLVPLSQVTTHDDRPELQSINHDNRQRAIRITANVAAGKAQSDALTYVQSLQAGLPAGYAIVLGGQSSQFGDAMTSLLFALVIGILVAYMVLASQFNSFMHPVTVLTILPLSLAGAMISLWITGKTLNVFSMIGLLLLMGIVKKNSIILVDYANEVREREKLDAREAMKRAGPVRLRPILMTAVATLMAAVPSALGLGPGSETRGPMADAIIGGLILSTVLSLYVVPSFYVLADAGKARLFGGKGPIKGPAKKAPPARPAAAEPAPASAPVPAPTAGAGT